MLQAEARAEFAEKTVKKLQKEVDRLEGLIPDPCSLILHQKYYFLSLIDLEDALYYVHILLIVILQSSEATLTSMSTEFIKFVYCVCMQFLHLFTCICSYYLFTLYYLTTIAMFGFIFNLQV